MLKLVTKLITVTQEARQKNQEPRTKTKDQRQETKDQRTRTKVRGTPNAERGTQNTEHGTRNYFVTKTVPLRLYNQYGESGRNNLHKAHTEW